MFPAGTKRVRLLYIPLPLLSFHTRYEEYWGWNDGTVCKVHSSCTSDIQPFLLSDTDTGPDCKDTPVLCFQT